MITFSFTINPKTQEAVWVGNISPQEALSLLQNIAFQDAIKKAKEEALAETPKQETPNGRS